MRAVNCTLRLLAIHQHLYNPLPLILPSADSEIEPSPRLGRPAVEGRARAVAVPQLGGDELDGFVAVGAEADAGADFAEGGGGFVDCEGYVRGGEEADGEGEAAEAAAADGDVDWLLWGDHGWEGLGREVRMRGGGRGGGGGGELGDMESLG